MYHIWINITGATSHLPFLTLSHRSIPEGIQKGYETCKYLKV